MPVSAWSWVSSIRSTSVSSRRKLGEDSSCLRRESLVGSEAAPSSFMENPKST